MNVKNRILGCLWSAFFALSMVATPAFAAKKPAGKKFVERKHKSKHKSSSSCSSSSSSSSSSSNGKKVYDYVIVGAGSAGSILARKLSDNRKKSVFVVTDGVNRNDDPLLLASFSDPAIFEDFWIITNDPQYAETYDCRVISPLQTTIVSEGTAWGGSSSHNYQLAVRGTPEIYDSWAATSGNPQWSYNNMLPLMLALENYNPCGSFDSSQRGLGGPISITQNPPVNTDPLCDALNTATTVGFLDDYNDPTEASSTGHFNLGYSGAQAFATLGNPSCTPGVERTGFRNWSANTFLDSAVVTKDGRGRGGRKLEIASNAHANKVLFKGKKAIGVQYAVEKDGNQEVQNVYGKQIILCAGALNSPAILERSGIGDPAVLGPLGIDVLVANPNVGNNMICQYGGFVVVSVPTDAISNNAFWNLAENPAISPPFNAVYNYPDDNTRRIQLQLLPGGPEVAEIAAFILEPQSVGSTHIVSRNPLVQPLLNLNVYTDGDYLTNGTDANKMMTAVNLIATGVGVDNMISPPGALFSTPPGTDPTSLEEAEIFSILTSPDNLQAADHNLASTRMGTSIVSGVVDGNLNVFGVENLMIADIGVLPLSPDGNPCYAAYMVGLRASTILGAPVPPAL